VTNENTDNTDEPTKAELHERVQQLESTVAKMMPSRRDALKLGAAGLAGAAGLGAASQSADASTGSAGTIGSTSDRPDLIADDVGPRSLASDYLYAGEFSGGSPDSRLSSCLNAATSGDVVRLESESYFDDLTTPERIKLIGTNPGARASGTFINGATWTISARTDIDSIGAFNGGTLQLNNNRAAATNISTTPNETVNIGANNVRLIGGHSLDVTINADDCVVLGLTNSTVTDNGSGNQVGFIS